MRLKVMAFCILLVGSSPPVLPHDYSFIELPESTGRLSSSYKPCIVKNIQDIKPTTIPAEKG
jgi:hypothetical protein